MVLGDIIFLEIGNVIGGDFNFQSGAPQYFPIIINNVMYSYNWFGEEEKISFGALLSWEKCL